jgi:uncharacterized protein YraI
MRPSPEPSKTPILRNPIVLGGLAAAVLALLVVVIVVVFAGGGGSGGNNDSAVRTATQTPQEGQTTNGGVTGKARATLNVRNGPGNTTALLGVLYRGTEVSVDGKSEDGEWLQIVYPPRSKLHGWVVASSLELQGDASELAVATPEEIPVVIAPTSAFVPTVEVTPTPELTAAAPTETPSPTEPDLVVGGWLVSGALLVVTVTNQGTGTLAASAIDVGVYDTNGTNLLDSTTSAPLNLSPGASIDIKTGYIAVGTPPPVLVIIDPNGKIAESDDTNNRLVVTFSNATPTTTPEAAATAAATP